MSYSIQNLAPHARVWIFQSDRFLTPIEIKHLEEVMQAFIPKWAAHGNELYGGFSVEENLFLVVGVDEHKSPASGCSIDSLTRVVKQCGVDLKIDFFNRMAIAYETESGNVEITTMTDFKQLIAGDKVNSNTIVFNNLVNTKVDFENKWRTQASNSWHTNLFDLV